MAASENKKPCRFCLNARVNHDLSDDNDLSYLPVGFSAEGFSLYLRSGGGDPVDLSFYRWMADLNQGEWALVAFYYPKFCPECGRPLMDDYPERRSKYGQEENS